METNLNIVISGDYLLALADNMAAAALAFSSHGYDQFIEAREQFKIYVKHVMSRIESNENLRDSS